MCFGSGICTLLRNLLKPATPEYKILDEIFRVFGRHYSPMPSAVVQRFRVNSRTRHDRQSVSDFVIALRSLSEHCGYDKQPDNMIRDWLVFGVHNATLQTRLHLIHDLTLEIVLTTALDREQTTENAGEICPSTPVGAGVFPTQEMITGKMQFPIAMVTNL